MSTNPVQESSTRQKRERIAKERGQKMAEKIKQQEIEKSPSRNTGEVKKVNSL